MDIKRVISCLLVLCILASGSVFYGKSEAEAKEDIELHPYGHMLGDGFVMRGKLKVSYNIRWAKACIYRQKTGKRLQKGGYKPKAKTINLYTLGKKVDFSKLKPGRHTIKIWARSAKSGKWYLLEKKDFSVSDIRAIDHKHPYNVRLGTSSFPRGKIESYFKFKQIKISVRDRKGKRVQSASMTTPGRGRKHFDMKNFERAGITLSKLPVGTYKYYVEARDTVGGKKVISNHYLDVIGKKDFKLRNASLPDKLKYGKPFSLLGYVEGKRRIRRVRAVVRRPSGEIVDGFDISEKKALGSNKADSSYIHHLNKLDLKVKFNKLPAGSYVYELHAAGKNGKQTRVVKKKFTVSRIKMSNIKESAESSTRRSGSTKKFTGTVSSTFPLKRLSIWLEDDGGKRISDSYQTVQPYKTKMYLGKTFKPIPTNNIKAAKYRLKVSATDEHGIRQVYKSPYYTSDYSSPPAKYKSRKLKYNVDRFKAIGKQPVSGPCGCYCMAYGRLVIDGQYNLVPPYKSYYNQIKADFGRGSHLAYWGDAGAASQYTNTYKGVYKMAASEIRAGKPCILQVDTGRGSNHFILAIGYRSYEKAKGARLKDFIVLDPACAREIKLWKENPDGYSNSTINKRIIKFNR